MMHHNSGDECSAYLQYIYDEYEALPPAVAFLQYASEQQLMLPSVILTIRAALSSVHRLGFQRSGVTPSRGIGRRRARPQASR